MSQTIAPMTIAPAQEQQSHEGSAAPIIIPASKLGGMGVGAPPTTIVAMNAAKSSLGESKSSTSSSSSRAKEEKVGRWTEHEHRVFLEGLERHGKQWKTIAAMIGTRTVVQVRTHAQKYFQKLEKRTSKGGSSSFSAVRPSVAASSAPSHVLPQQHPIVVGAGGTKKRKSLPASFPSRKKPKSPSKKFPTRGSLPQLSSISSTSPPPGLPTYPSYVSNTSLSSSEAWSTLSPTVVTEIAEFTMDELKSEFPFSADGDDSNDETTAFELSGFGDDPLEWLVHSDGSLDCLPESSLPAFPSLDHEASAITEDTPPLDLQHQQLHHSAMIEDAVNNIVDPNVTVQSLLL